MDQHFNFHCFYTTIHDSKAQLEATVGLQYNAQFTLHCSFMFILKLTAKPGSVIQPDAF